jgi:hypothetical protein
LDAHLEQLVRGRCVALVGPSRSIAASGYGAAIDRHAIVARLNHGWPVPKRLWPDQGTRLDLLYHCCNGDYPLQSVLSQAPWPHHVCVEQGPQTEVLRAACNRQGIRCTDITDLYAALTHSLGTFPNTGLVALHHLLSHGVASVTLYGLTFYREGYLHGYQGDGASAENWPSSGAAPSTIWKHDLERQYRHFLALYHHDLRIHVDARSQAVMVDLADHRNHRGAEARQRIAAPLALDQAGLASL